MDIHGPNFIGAAREYLVKRVGISSANTQLFLYLLEGEDLAGFRALLEKGEEENADSKEVIGYYLKRQAALRQKAILLADLYGLSDPDDRISFIADTMLQRERFLPLEKLETSRMKEYAEKVKAGMDARKALGELGLRPDGPSFETVYDSFDWED